MNVFDVREENSGIIDTILFACEMSSDKEPQAYKLHHSEHNRYGSYVELCDSEGDVVIINTEEHAKNLIKALNKAIELGWLT